MSLKGLKGITSTPKINQAKEEFREYMEAKYPIFVAEDSSKFLSNIGYNVLNLIEIRKQRKNEH